MSPRANAKILAAAGGSRAPHGRFAPIAHALPWLLIGATLLGVWQAPLRIHQDCAMCLQQGELLLSGAVPCCDFVDTNPPLIAYINVVPAAIAHALQASPILVFNLFVVLLLLVSSVEIFLLLRKQAMRLRLLERDLVLLAWVVLYFCVDWLGNTGQREHLFVLLYVPYLFLRILRHQGGAVAGWFAVLLGLQAALGASLKPHFLLAAAAIEGVLLLDTLCRRKGDCPNFCVSKNGTVSLGATSWRLLARPENAALAVGVAAYMVHWLFVPAAMREAFFGRWVPMICRGYRAFDAPQSEIIRVIFLVPLSAVAVVGVVGGATLAARPRTRCRRLFLAMAAFGVMGMVLIFAQQKGWRYQKIPLETAGMFCLALLVARVFSRQQRLRSLLVPAGAAISVAFLAAWFVEREDYGNNELPDYAILRRIVETRTQPGERVLIVTTSVSPASPMLLKTGRLPGSRYLHCFPIAMLYADTRWSPDRPAYRTYDEAPPEERRFLDDLQEDVQKFQPRLIIICNALDWHGLAKQFNIFDYMVYNGWTGRAMASYREVSGLRDWKVFERE